MGLRMQPGNEEFFTLFSKAGSNVVVFYDRNASAISRTGKKGSAVKISDVKRELKDLHGLTQPQVMSNLTYLIDMRWVKTFDVEKQVGTKGGTLVPSSVTWYEIAAPGIDKIDGDCEFTPPSRFAGVNISATGTNVITMGDGNVVNVDHRELHAELNTLRDQLAASDKLTEADKLDLVADIESLKDQLAKPPPQTRRSSGSFGRGSRRRLPWPASRSWPSPSRPTCSSCWVDHCLLRRVPSLERGLPPVDDDGAALRRSGPVTAPPDRAALSRARRWLRPSRVQPPRTLGRRRGPPSSYRGGGAFGRLPSGRRLPRKRGLPPCAAPTRGGSPEPSPPGTRTARPGRRPLSSQRFPHLHGTGVPRASDRLRRGAVATAGGAGRAVSSPAAADLPCRRWPPSWRGPSPTSRHCRPPR